MRASRVVPVTELALRNCNKFEGSLGNLPEKSFLTPRRLKPRHHFESSANRIRAWGNWITLRQVERISVQTRKELPVPTSIRENLEDYRKQARGSLGCCCCYQVNVLTTAVVGDTTDVENFDLESWVRPSEKGEGRERDESGCWERDVMLARRQRSMVARGSLATMVGINIGCRRHLRRPWWCKGEWWCWGKRGRVRRWALKARRALNLFSRFTWLHRTFWGVRNLPSLNAVCFFDNALSNRDADY